MNYPILKPYWQIKDIVQITGLSRGKVVKVLSDSGIERFGKGSGYYSMDVVRVFEMEEWYEQTRNELLKNNA